MHDFEPESELGRVVEVVGDILSETLAAATLRDEAMAKRFELFAARDELAAIRLDLASLVDQRAATERGATAEALVELDERIATRFAERFCDLDAQTRELVADLARHQADIERMRAGLETDLKTVLSRVDAAADANSQLEVRLSERFELDRRERAVETREGILAVAAPRQALDALAVEVKTLVERFEDALISLAAEGARIEASATDRVMLTVRELGLSIAERFEALRASVKDGETGPAGPQGERGLGVFHRGTYSAAETYAINDEVMSKGSTFRAIVDNPGALPGPDWQMAAQRGKQGDPGRPGPQGERGPPGPMPNTRFVVAVTVGDKGIAQEFSDGAVEVAPFPAQLLAAMADFEVVA